MGTRVLVAATLGAALLLAGGAQAQQVFKCVDRSGHVTYSDSACPANAAKAHDITGAVQACSDEECERRQQREMESARQRLQEDKQALTDMISQRRKADAEYLEQMAKLQEIKARQTAAERSTMNDPYGERWGYGWGLPGYGYGIARPPHRARVWPPGVAPHQPARLDPMYTSPPVSIRVR